jgi:hypothetical protein
MEVGARSGRAVRRLHGLSVTLRQIWGFDASGDSPRGSRSIQPRGFVARGLRDLVVRLVSKMKKTMPPLARALYRRSCYVLAGLSVLIVAGGLSPSAAGHLDAVIVTTLSLGDDDSLSSPSILPSLDNRVSVVMASRGPADDTESTPPAMSPVDGGPVAGDLGDGVIGALDPVSEVSLGELADVSGNPSTIEGLWKLRLGSREDLDKVQLAAGTAVPGLYDDPDWFESVTLVMVGGGAGVALVFLGLSSIRIHRRHRSRSPSLRRPHRRPHRAR